jgi:hypothetical protein
MVNTAEVLMLAQATSETASPFQLDQGYVFTDTSDTTSPISVNTP